MPRHRFTVEPRPVNAARVAELRALRWGIPRIARAIGATEEAVRAALRKGRRKLVGEWTGELAAPAWDGCERRAYPRQ